MNDELVQRVINRIGELEFLLMQSQAQINQLQRSIQGNGNSGSPTGASEVQQQARAGEAQNGEE